MLLEMTEPRKPFSKPKSGRGSSRPQQNENKTDVSTICFLTNVCVCVDASTRAKPHIWKSREQLKSHFSPTSRCAPGITQAMRLMRQAPHCLSTSPMLYFDGLSLLCCRSHLNNCPFSFIFSAWKLTRHERLVQTIYHLTSPVPSTLNIP